MKVFGKKGFTFVELMIVLVIIAILAAVAIPIYTRSQEKAAESACIQNQKLIHLAAEEYNNVNSSYPENVQILVDEDYLQFMPKCSGLIYTVINPDGTVECPRESNKH
ncbi:MAG: prepilin-type N-terminal cleavage/methylation domain-containing protein [Clostridiaceae bacterium]|nr:prepilin-type N-terminal cleavage/methylation domain-containing protein [Clostridiaceae bacterium]